MLDGRFDDDELVVVLAHEVGHHARDHIAEGHRAGTRSSRFPARGSSRASRAGAAGMRDAGSRSRSPLLVLVVPLSSSRCRAFNAITRHMEAEADWVALEATEDPAAADAALRGLLDRAPRRPGPARLGVSRSSRRTRRSSTGSRWSRPGRSAGEGAEALPGSSTLRRRRRRRHVVQVHDDRARRVRRAPAPGRQSALNAAVTRVGVLAEFCTTSRFSDRHDRVVDRLVASRRRGVGRSPDSRPRGSPPRRPFVPLSFTRSSRTCVIRPFVWKSTQGRRPIWITRAPFGRFERTRHRRAASRPAQVLHHA